MVEKHAKPQSRREQDEVIDLAIDLYSEEVRERERAEEASSMIAAAREVGVPEEYLARAAEVLREKRAAAAARRERVRKGIAGAVAASGVLAIVVAGWFFLAPGPAAPFVEGFARGQERWTLDKNAGTAASVRFEQRADRGEVAVVSVQRFSPGADGKFFVNLDSLAGPADLGAHRELSFALRGTGLETVRVFVEGEGERWRSPPLAIGGEWRTVRVPLSSFERQVLRGGTWIAAGHGAPDGGGRISFKVGHFMNEADASGEVELDDLRIE